MPAKRERLDVIYDILTTARKNNNLIRPTRLIQSSNLSPKMFKDYLNELLESGLLQEIEEGGSRYYAVADKGHRFLERYHVFREFVSELGL